VLRARVPGWGRFYFGGVVSVCVVIAAFLSWPKLGVRHEGLRGDDASYLALCDWTRDSTPTDAVFLVPPDEESFRLHARRAIVVNFKNVPQLSGELGEWRRRLQNVLDVDVTTLPTPFHRTRDAIRARYADLSPEGLATAARRNGARYVVSVRPFDADDDGTLVFSTPDGKYFLYDLGETASP
jgi:hypothetical protein